MKIKDKAKRKPVEVGGKNDSMRKSEKWKPTDKIEMFWDVSESISGWSSIKKYWLSLECKNYG